MRTSKRLFVGALALLAAFAATRVSSAGDVLTGQAALDDWHGDKPGVRRHIVPADLPPPYASYSASHGSAVADLPAGALPQVPPGFAVSRFAAGLDGPRTLRVAPNGDIFVAETGAGTIKVLRAPDGGKEVFRQDIFASGLEGPFGIDFYPPGPEPKWVYVAQHNSVLRYSYRPGDLKAAGAPEIVVARLAPSTGGHTTRDLRFSLDGKRMFVSVGSGSNVAERMRRMPVPQAAQWEHSHGLGAAWDEEENRADVLVFDPDGKNPGVFATGIRNCVGLAVHPATGDLYCSTNERDGLGDNLVPDYVTRVREGAFYGWPWFYIGDNPDPSHAGARADLKGKITVPDVLIQPHSASLGLTFYGGDAFPADYRGDGFAAEHGSWNRAKRTGYKVIRIRLRDGIPTGEYEDFVTGFVVSDAAVWGRPVSVAVGPDGALYFSDDGGGAIWRVEYDRR